MAHLILGIITITFSCIITFFSWRTDVRNHYKTSLFLIILTGFILRIYTGSDLYLHDWDEKYHALVAKNMIDHPLEPRLYKNHVIPYDYKNWTGNSVWLEKPPVPLWGLAGSIALFGTNEIAVRLPSLLLSTLAIFLTYLIGTILFNRKIGLLAAFLHAINGLVIELAAGRISSDHVETFFIFFVELSMLLCILSIRKKQSTGLIFLAGLTTGISLLCKWTPGLVVLPVWLGAAIWSKRYTFPKLIQKFLIILFTSAVVFLPWIFYILRTFPEESGWVLKKFLFAYSESVEGHSAPFWYYLNYAGIIFGELIILPVLFQIFLWIKKKMNWQLVFLNLWWLIPVFIFSFAATKRHTYLLMAAPAFFVIIAYAIYYMLRLRHRFRHKWIVTGLAILLVALPVRYCLERVKPFEKRDMNPQWAIDLRNLKNKIPQSDKTVVFNLDHPVEAMFYNNFTAYSHIPDKPVIDNLIRKQYIVYIIRSDRGSDSLQRMANGQ